MLTPALIAPSDRAFPAALEGFLGNRAKEALERSETLTAFRARVASLRGEWEELAAAAERDEDEETRAQRRTMGAQLDGSRGPA